MFDEIYNCKILYIMDERFLAYSKGEIFIYDKAAGQKNMQIALPMSIWRKVFSKIRILERIFRLEPRLAFMDTQGNICITYRGYIYRLDMRSKKLSVVYTFRSGMNNPLSVTHIKATKNFHEQVVFGEYLDGEKCAVSIISENGEYKKVYEFPKGQIDHIHGIVQDRHRDKVYILTGDTDAGSGIWESCDDFSKVSPLLVGKQIYRCCVLFPTEKGILYATDTPLEQNKILFIDNSFYMTELYEMPGPCIYGMKFTDSTGKQQYAFATSVEPDSQKGRLEYLFTCKKGPGIKDYYVHMIVGSQEDGFCEIGRMQKDGFPMTLGQFGNAQFPKGCTEDNLIITPSSVKHYDGKSVRLILKKGKKNV